MPSLIAALKGKVEHSKGRNSLNRLLKYQDNVLAFTNCGEVSFTNNLSERDIRPIKGKIKDEAHIQCFIKVFEELLNIRNQCNFIANAYTTTK